MNSLSELSLNSRHIMSSRDCLNDMATMDQILLQQMMQQKNQLQEALSNIMKASGQSDSTMTSNLK